MINLLQDTLQALAFYGKDATDVDGIIFYNEDSDRMEGLTWQNYVELIKDVNYDPYDFEFIGRRVFKPAVSVVGEDWFLARTLVDNNYEGWVYYDSPLMKDGMGTPITLDSVGVPSVEPDVNLLAFIIADVSAHYSDYRSDYDFEANAFPGEYSQVPDVNNVPQVNIIHGVNGRVYWTDHQQYNKHPQLLWNPTIVNMVIAGEHRNPDVFNNENLSQIIGVENANYIEHGQGDLEVSTIPVHHFTIYMDDDDNEVIQLTLNAPYYNTLLI